MARCGLRRRLFVSSGQTNVEYALVAIVIGLTVLFLVSKFGGGVSQRFHCMTLQLGLVRIDPKNSVSMTDELGCSKQAKAAIPPPPLASDPLTAQVRHHIGDGLCSGPTCGGSLKSEGLSLKVPFTLTQDQIDFANANGNKIFLRFEGSGIDLSAPDKVSIGADPLARINNGTNTVTIDATNLKPGDYEAKFDSGKFSGSNDFDDLEINNVRIVFDPTG